MCAARNKEDSPSDFARAKSPQANFYCKAILNFYSCEILFIGKKDERGVVLPFFFVTSYIDFKQIFSI